MVAGEELVFRERVGAWVREAQAGSREALSQLLIACQPHLLLIARRDLPVELQAEAHLTNVVRETLLEADHRFEQFANRHEDEFFEWLKGMLQRNISYLRRRNSRVSYHDRPRGAESTVAPDSHAGDMSAHSPAAAGAEESSRDIEQREEDAVRAPSARDPIGAVDDFQLLREIGRGGMGIIYEAWQTTLRRRVAIKILPSAATLDPRRLARFQNEARFAATLDHPHIVKIFAVGGGDSVPYFAMQYIDGRSLAEEIDALREYGGDLPLSEAHTRDAPQADAGASARPPTDRSTARLKAAELGDLTASYGGRPFFQRAARLGIQICEAIDHAHSRGIIHRDIKPANLLVDDRDWLWVADFGLARTLADSSLSTAGDMMGTLRYASPEQALGKATISERSDVYSVGASLYELVTLAPLHTEEAPESLLQAVVQGAPVRPRRLIPQIPPDFETILLKATSKDQEDRYASALDLAYDLQAFLDDRPIRARRSNVLDRLVKWSRRNTVSVNATLITAALMLIVAAMFLYVEQQKTRAALRNARQSYQLANKAGARAEQAARQLADQLYVNRILHAGDARWEGDPQRAVQYLKTSGDGSAEMSAAENIGDAKHRGFAWRFLKRLCEPAHDSIELSQFPLYCVTFSPDGETIAVSGQDAIVRLLDAKTLEPRNEWPTEQREVNQVSFAPDGERLATAGDKAGARIWRTSSNELLRGIDAHKNIAFQATFARDGKSLFTSGDENKVRRFDAESGALLSELEIDGKSAVSLAQSLDEKWLAIAEEAPSVALYDLAASAIVARLPLRAAAASVAFSRDGRWLAAGDKSGEVRVFSTSPSLQAAPLQTFEHSDAICGVSFSPDSLWLATADRGGVVSVQPVGDEAAERSGETPSDGKAAQLLAYRSRLASNHLLRWRAHLGRAYDVAWSPDGASLFSVGHDGKICKWRPFAACVVRPIGDGLERDVDFAAAPQDDVFVVLSNLPERSHLRWIDARGDILRSDPPLNGKFDRLAISGDGVRLAFKAVGGEHVELIYAAKPQESFRNREGRGFDYLIFSPDGRSLAAAQSDDRVQLIDSATGEKRDSFPTTNSSAVPAFSRNGEFLAIDSANDIEIWNLKTREKTVLEGHTSTINQMQFSSDGRTLASVSNDRTLRLWSIETKELRLEITGHANRLTSLAFAPDDETIATGDAGGSIKLWSAEYGVELCTLVEWGDPIEKLAFSRKGRYLAWRIGESIWVADAGPTPDRGKVN